MIDLTAYLERQKKWSERTFGIGKRTIGVTKHIEAEIEEIRQEPSNSKEWIDIIILAVDGYWRSGGDNLELDLLNKQQKNFMREWPKPESEDVPSMHVRGIHD